MKTASSAVANGLVTISWTPPGGNATSMAVAVGEWDWLLQFVADGGYAVAR